MSIQVAWDNEAKTVIRFDFAGKWNWYGYEMAVGEAFGMAEGAGQLVDFIFNMKDSAALAEGATFYFKRTLELTPNSQSVLIIAHADATTEAAVALFSRIYKKLGERLLMARTLDKARAMLSGEPEPPAPKPSVIRLIAAK
jgi:hypothetical protein